MSQTSRVRVYLGCSLDGFIADPNDDLSWLSEAGAPGESDPGALFDGLVTRTRLEFVAHRRFQGSALQVVARVRR